MTIRFWAVVLMLLVGGASLFAPIQIAASPADQQSYGTYVWLGQERPIAPHHVTTTRDSLSIKAPLGSTELRLDKATVENYARYWASTEAVRELGNRLIVGARAVTLHEFKPSTSEVYSFGSPASIEVHDRPMWIAATPAEHKTLRLSLSDGNPTGQVATISAGWLRDLGIYKPQAMMEDGTAVAVTYDQPTDKFTLDIPHFSIVILTPADIDIRGRQAGVFIPHDGTVTWDSAAKQLEVNVTQKIANYETWIERDWVDARMPSVGLHDRTWTIQETDGKEFYVVSLTPSDTPPVLRFAEFEPAAEPVYTWGNPASMEIAHSDRVARTNIEPMWIQLTTSNGTVFNVSRGTDMVLRVNDTWLEEIARTDPLFMTGNTTAAAFDLTDAPGWGLVVRQNSTITIVDGASTPNETAFLAFQDLEEPEDVSFAFVPSGYNVTQFITNNSTEYYPPDSIEIEGHGTMGSLFRGPEFTELGIASDFMPANQSEPYRLGVWLETANLHAVHQRLMEEKAGALANRTTDYFYRWDQGVPELPFRDSRNTWRAAELQDHAFGNPNVFGPAWNRLNAPLANIAGSLSLCAFDGACDGFTNFSVTIAEDSTQHQHLSEMTTNLINEIGRCLESAADCPVSNNSTIQFLTDLGYSVENGSVASDASLDVSFGYTNGTAIACVPCNLTGLVEDLLYGSRSMVNNFIEDPNLFDIGPTARAHFGCEEGTPECNSVATMASFPYQSPLKCIEEKGEYVLQTLEGPIPYDQDLNWIDVYVSVTIPELSTCWGLDLGTGADDLLPDLTSLTIACTAAPGSSGPTTVSCNPSDDSMGFVWNINPVSFLTNPPWWWPCQDPFLCALAGIQQAMGEIEEEAGVPLTMTQMDVGFVGCNSLEHEAIENHDELHDNGNAGFLVTHTPWPCALDWGEPSGFSGQAKNMPAWTHSNPQSEESRMNPTVVWMWDLAALILSPHEFGHAVGALHDDAKCWEESAHWIDRPHASWMAMTSADSVQKDCFGTKVWKRHYHAVFTTDAESAMYDGFVRHTAKPSFTHEQVV